MSLLEDIFLLNYSTIISLAVIMCILLFDKDMQKDKRKLLYGVFIMEIISLIVNIMNRVLASLSYPTLLRTGVIIVKSLIPSAFIYILILIIITSKPRRIKIGMSIPLIIGVIIFSSAFFNDYFFGLDSNNQLYFGPYKHIMVDLALVYVVMLLCTALFIVEKNEDSIIIFFVVAFLSVAIVYDGFVRTSEGLITNCFSLISIIFCVVLRTRQRKQEQITEDKVNQYINMAYRSIRAAMVEAEYTRGVSGVNIIWNQELEGLFGKREAEGGWVFINPEESFYPEDEVNFRNLFIDITIGHKDEISINTEVRILVNGESYQWFRIVGEAKVDNKTSSYSGDHYLFYGMIVNIEAQKEIERRLSVLEEDGKGLFKHLGAYQWSAEYSPDGKMLSAYVANGFRSLTGFTDVEKYPHENLVSFEHVYPDDLEMIKEKYLALKEDMNLESGFDVEYRLICLDRKPIWVRSVIAYIETLPNKNIIFHGVLFNIDERKNTVIENNTRLAIVEALSMDYQEIFIVDLNNESSTALKIRGQMIPDPENHTHNYTSTWESYIRRYVYKDDQKMMEETFNKDNVRKRLNAEGEILCSYRIELSDGIHYHQVKYVLIPENEFHEEIIVAGYRKVDELVEAEKRQSEMLHKALDDAQHANMSKSMFLFNMSHDIRTPMNAILGFADMARKHIDDKDNLDRYLSNIEVSGEQLLGLINSILDMSRIESGKMELNEEPQKCREIMMDTYTSLVQEAKKKNIELSVDIDIIHENVYCDRVKLTEILLNVVGNAIKYTLDGGKVKVFLTEKGLDEKGRCILETVVIDTGIGMSEDFLPHIFDSFERERTATKSGVIGTGLGMSITKKLVDLMDGSIQVKSAPNQGTTVIISLPHQIASEENDNSDKTEEVSSTTIQGKRVLLAEDNGLNAEIAIMILSENGMEVDLAIDGLECVEMIRKAPAGRYDMILMDIQMPNMDGYIATSLIRDMPEKAKASIPIIAMTANAFDEDKKKAFAVGMNDFITKPINISELKNIISRNMK